ncbi:hypothetical protein RM6536_0414 [Rothia mucilaginosa]|uniref:Uncharacterized protein n=1 Tax=Rothia mucilaginosa TaxID=43675 RepID=A0A0K2RXT4_9MICC|nr:hypothetical protein RM6536_0414 [Rothia mucilaginosa]
MIVVRSHRLTFEISEYTVGWLVLSSTKRRRSSAPFRIARGRFVFLVLNEFACVLTLW